MKKLFGYFLNILIFAYAIYDVMSSASAGNSNDQRIQVYIFLFAIILIMALSIFIHRIFKIDNITRSFLIYVVYYLFDVFFIKNKAGWGELSSFALCLWWLFTITYFRDEQKRNEITYTIYKNFARGMFIFYFFVIFYSSRNISNNFSSVSYARVGYIYHIMGLLPLLLLERNRMLKYVFIILTTIVTIFSFKRGAIIILPIMLFVYFIVDNRNRKTWNIKRVLVLFSIFLIIWVVIDKYSNGYLVQRFSLEELSDGSGRVSIINTILNNVSKRNILQTIFGIASPGEYSTSVGAHNEWINQLNEYGILGVIFYACIMFSLLKFNIKLIKKRSIFAASFSAMMVYSLGIGLVSGWLFMHSTFYIMLYIGLVLALYDKNDDYIEAIVG